ncbi:MAG: LysR family transcriptional regulator [Rhizobiales bacterium]|nr:LysR family transcriptional regulator [Hyphomicrobiales bacterium]
MDIVLLKTFLTVLTTESFVAAAQRLFVTQSAVSLRVQKMEALVGHKLFERNKGGVVPTVEGEKFETYARSMLQLWDEALYQVGLPTGFSGSVALACQDSLWPELSSKWVAQLAKHMPNTAINFQIGMPIVLTNMLVRGRIDIAVLYNPEIRQGFKVERLMEDRLVLVSSQKNHNGELKDDYVFANWGQEFSIAHSRFYPDLPAPQIMLQVGGVLPNYLIENKKTAYMPHRIADDYVAAGKLHLVKDAPNFPFPAYAVWTEHKSEEILMPVLEQLRIAAKNAPWIELGG